MTPEELSALSSQLFKAMPAAMQEAIDKKKDGDADDKDDKKDGKEKVDKAAEALEGDSKKIEGDSKALEKSVTLTESELNTLLEKAAILGAQVSMHGFKDQIAPLEKSVAVMSDSTQSILDAVAAQVLVLKSYQEALNKTAEISKSQSLYTAAIATSVDQIANQPAGRRSLDTASLVEKNVEIKSEELNPRALLDKLMEINKANTGLSAVERQGRTASAMHGDFTVFSETERAILGVK